MKRSVFCILIVNSLLVGAPTFAQSSGAVKLPVDVSWSQLAPTELESRGKTIYRVMVARGMTVNRLILVNRRTHTEIARFDEVVLRSP